MQCNNLRAALRAQGIVWPSFVGSLISLVLFIASAELFLRYVTNDIWIIPVADIIAMAG